jgi:hypothetical protein
VRIIKKLQVYSAILVQVALLPNLVRNGSEIRRQISIAIGPDSPCIFNREEKPSFQFGDRFAKKNKTIPV